jgi:AcrR family transcriptional regulator
MPSLSQAAPPARRKRRTAEEARRAILEAAQRRLAEVGPEDIRLQDIAADVGISHPAILHHFGSRDALMRELSRHAFRALNEDLLRVLEQGEKTRDEGGARDLSAWLAQVFETLRDQGHARLLAWSTLTGRLEEGAGEDDPTLLRDLARALHARRVAAAEAAGRQPPTRQETLFAMQFVSAALLGDALFGDALRRSGGVHGDAALAERYHRWLAAGVSALLVPPTPADD